MNKILSTIFLSALSVAQIYAQGMHFETGDWASVKAKAKAESKPIFMDIYATWCGPCKQMSKTVFTNPTVGEFMNANYINYKVDGEEGEGIALAETYQINAYPTLLFFDKEGNLVHKNIGSEAVEDFITLSKNTLLPENQFYTLHAKYENGERDKTFLKKYIKLLSRVQGEALEVTEIYWAKLSDKEKLEAENIELVVNTVFNIHSPIVQHFIQNRAAYEKALDIEAIKNYCNEILAQGISAAQIDNSLTEKTFKNFAKTYYSLFKDSKYVDAKVPYLFYANQEVSTPNTYKQSDKYFSTYAEWHEIVSPLLYRFYVDEHFPAKDALKWANRAVSLEANFYTYMLRANIYEKLNKKKEAIADFEKVKAYYIEMGEDASEIQYTIDRLSK